MRAPDGAELQAPQLDALAGLEHDPLDLGPQLFDFEAREHRAHEFPGSLLEVLRTRDYDRMFARTLPQVFEEEKRQPAEMVAMQMADDDRVERVGLDTVALHLGQHAW